MLAYGGQDFLKGLCRAFADLDDKCTHSNLEYYQDHCTGFTIGAGFIALLRLSSCCKWLRASIAKNEMLSLSLGADYRYWISMRYSRHGEYPVVDDFVYDTISKLEPKRIEVSSSPDDDDDDANDNDEEKDQRRDVDDDEIEAATGVKAPVEDMRTALENYFFYRLYRSKHHKQQDLQDHQPCRNPTWNRMKNPFHPYHRWIMYLIYTNDSRLFNTCDTTSHALWSLGNLPTCKELNDFTMLLPGCNDQDSPDVGAFYNLESLIFPTRSSNQSSKQQQQQQQQQQLFPSSEKIHPLASRFRNDYDPKGITSVLNRFLSDAMDIFYPNGRDNGQLRSFDVIHFKMIRKITAAAIDIAIAQDDIIAYKKAICTQTNLRNDLNHSYPGPMPNKNSKGINKEQWIANLDRLPEGLANREDNEEFIDRCFFFGGYSESLLVFSTDAIPPILKIDYTRTLELAIRCHSWNILGKHMSGVVYYQKLLFPKYYASPKQQAENYEDPEFENVDEDLPGHSLLRRFEQDQTRKNKNKIVFYRHRNIRSNIRRNKNQFCTGNEDDDMCLYTSNCLDVLAKIVLHEMDCQEQPLTEWYMSNPTYPRPCTHNQVINFRDYVENLIKKKILYGIKLPTIKSVAAAWDRVEERMNCC